MNKKKLAGLNGLLERWNSTTKLNYGTFRGLVRHTLAQWQLWLGQLSPWTQFEPGKHYRLVFVCLGNINRSAFAAEVARRVGQSAISVGLSTNTGVPATSMAITQAQRQGYDLSNHTATDLKDYQYAPDDLLLVMEVRHLHQLIGRGFAPESIVLLGAWASPQRVHLHDPHTLSADYFSTCFTLIESAVRNLTVGLQQSETEYAKQIDRQLK